MAPVYHGAVVEADELTAPGTQVASAGPAPGERWARYTLGEQLGAGGMGTVFVAHDPELDREVALKVLHDDDLARAGQERLRREARALARIAHPNVVPVHEVGEHGGRTYYTMERIHGRSLRGWLAQRRGWREVVPVFVEVARGLAAIHAAGLIHRDVKPGNVLIGDDGRVRIADLGLVGGAVGPAGSIVVDTTTVRGAGTLAYMAPEQLDGAIGDPRADQFALGVSLFEALHGRPPFLGDTIGERRAAIARGPAAGDPSVPAWLDAIARRAMAEDPGARFPDVAAVAAALAGPPRRRWPVRAGAVAVIALAGGAALWLRTGSDNGARCAAVARELDGTWDAAVRSRLEAGFAASRVPFAARTGAEIVRAIDGYARSWSDARLAACQAGAPASITGQRRALCLDQRRLELRRLIGVVDPTDAAVLGRATSLLRGLSLVEDCSDPGYLEGLAPGPLSDTRARVIEARIDQFSGRTEPALAGARRAADEALAAGDGELAGEALTVLGLAQRDHGDLTPAITTLRDAVAQAPAAAVRGRIDAWLALADALARSDRLDDADATVKLVADALARAPDPVRAVRLAILRGTQLGRRSDYARAVAAFEDARSRAEALYGADSWRMSPIHQNLATALRRLGRHDEAITHARRSVALLSVLGAEHPETLIARRVLAQTLEGAGKHGEALAEHQALLAVKRAQLGDDHLDVAEVRISVGVALAGLGRNEEAADQLRAALAILERRAPTSKLILTARSNLAEVLTLLHRGAEALPLHRAVLAARIDLLGEHHVDVALSHLNLGVCLLALEQRAEARDELAAARAIFVERLGPDHARVHEIDELLARR